MGNGSAKLQNKESIALEQEQVKREMERLERELEKHARLYYELDAPVIEDSEYDRMFEALKRLEAEYPELASPYLADASGGRSRIAAVRKGAPQRADGQPDRCI